MLPSKKDFTFFLVGTQFASNLGSAVRVMRNMGFHRLTLVRPDCEVGMEARSYAMKGAEILDQAEIVPTLKDAAIGVDLLVGTTGRFRSAGKRLIQCPDLVPDVLSKLGPVKVGIVMGSEDNGLRREELRLCHWLVEIPTDGNYPVINLAQATAIVAYQLNLGFIKQKTEGIPDSAIQEKLSSLLIRAESTLEQLDLPTRVPVSRLMIRLKKIVGRAQLESEDVAMLHGILKEVGRKLESDREEG